MQGWKGVLVPIITPFTKDDKLYEKSLAAHIDWLIANEVDGIVVGGSTGENTLLSFEEKRKLYELTVKYVNKRVPLIAGATADSTDESMVLAQMAQAAGVDGLLVMPPTYSKVNQEQAYMHLKTVADSVELPIMIYNNPSRAMINLSVETVIALSQIENMVCMKESGGEVERIHKICRATSDDFTIVSGNDTIALEMMFAGAKGWVPSPGNIFPAGCCKATHLMLQGDLNAAQAVFRELLPSLELVEESGNFIQALKYVLNNKRDYQVGNTRRPLSFNDIDEETKKALLALAE